MRRPSALFLSLIGWVSAVALLMQFVYLPTHEPLSLGESVLAGSLSILAVSASLTALTLATIGVLRRTRLSENVLAFAAAASLFISIGVAFLAYV